MNFVELKSQTGQMQYEPNFNSKKADACSIMSSNSQSSEISNLREDNLKMEKTIADLKIIINKNGGLCSLDQSSLEKELDVLKKSNLFVIKLL